MRCSRKIAAIIATLLFAGTAYFIHAHKEIGVITKPTSLSSQLSTIEGWQSSRVVPLAESIVKELEIDDYIYQQYQSEGRVVTLYIGYYWKQDNVGAAHDPLVCFPGQGWVLSERGKGRLPVPLLQKTIDYATMTASRGMEKERILYWFQAGDAAVASTFEQKIAAFISKVEGKGGESAFVRMSCSINQTSTNCDQVMLDFAVNFYPIFQKYISNR